MVLIMQYNKNYVFYKFIAIIKLSSKSAKNDKMANFLLTKLIFLKLFYLYMFDIYIL